MRPTDHDNPAYRALIDEHNGIFRDAIREFENECHRHNVRLVFHGFFTAIVVFSLLFVYVTQDCPQ